MKTFILLLWLIPIALNVYVDRDGRKPNYLQMFVIRGFAAILHAIILDVVCDVFPDNLWRYNAIELILIWMPVFLFQITSFWILFEIFLNIVRKRELFYFDRQENDSGWTDQIFDALGNGAHLAAKIVALIICVLSVMAIYNS